LGISPQKLSSIRLGDFEARRGKLEIRHGTKGEAKRTGSPVFDRMRKFSCDVSMTIVMVLLPLFIT
jgi:hypothetical protein